MKQTFDEIKQEYQETQRDLSQRFGFSLYELAALSPDWSDEQKARYEAFQRESEALTAAYQIKADAARLGISFETVDGLLYVNLGAGDLAQAVCLAYEADHGGSHTTRENGDILYYNGGANEAIYCHTVATYKNGK